MARAAVWNENMNYAINRNSKKKTVGQPPPSDLLELKQWGLFQEGVIQLTSFILVFWLYKPSGFI